MLVSEGFKCALTCVDTATGLLQAFPYTQTTGKVPSTPSLNSVVCAGTPKNGQSKGLISQTQICRTGWRTITSNLIIWKKGCIAKIAIQKY